MQPVFKRTETETKRQGGSVITSRFVEKTPRRRLSSISWWAPRRAAPTAETGRLTPLSCACSGSPLALFSPVLPPPDSQAERERKVREHREERCATSMFFHPTVRGGRTLGLILPSFSPDFNSLPLLHRAGYQRNEITKVLGRAI